MLMGEVVQKWIGNSALLARAQTYVREGRVPRVFVRKENRLQVCEGTVTISEMPYEVSFSWDTEELSCKSWRCTCMTGVQENKVCRHVVALMLAACDADRVENCEIRDVQTLEGLLETCTPYEHLYGEEEPVHLYPELRRVSTQQVALSLKIGRTRAYAVRSMAEFAERIETQQKTTYGKDLTFGHREEELAENDRALFGQIAMLAGNPTYIDGGELMLSGMALDQTMRMLVGRAVDVQGAQDAIRSVRVERGDIALAIDVTKLEEGANLQVTADDVTMGSIGAYQFTEERILCSFGIGYRRIAGLLKIAGDYPTGMTIPEVRMDEVCAKLILPASAYLKSGEDIVEAHMPTAVTPRLYIDRTDEDELVCRTAFDYGGTELFGEEACVGIKRNLALETAARGEVQKLFRRKDSEDIYYFEGDDDARFALLSEQLGKLERIGEVHISKRMTEAHVSKKRMMAIGVNATDQKDGKMMLQADLGGFTQEELTKALMAYREKRPYVRMTNGTVLSGEALKQAADTAQVLEGLDVTAEQAEQGVMVSQSRAMYLDAAMKKRPEIQLSVPEEITDWTQRMEQAQHTVVEQPKGLKAQLRSYQAEGLSWLCALSDAGFSGLLADDMGLGKTIQVLSMLQRELEMGRKVRALVVCPASLQLNWLAEAKRFVPELQSASLTGTSEMRTKRIAEEINLLITSYDQLRRDVLAYEHEAFTHVLLDEAQYIKNADSQAAKAVKSLQAERRFAMTGTPIENRLSELWSLFDFLMPGYLGNYKVFRERFEVPVVREGDEETREHLHLLVAPFILRRMKTDVLKDLPEKVETVMESEMTEEQRKLYAAYVSQLRGESHGAMQSSQERMKILSGLTRLRQICCDPALCFENYTGGSGKMMQMLEVVQDALAGRHRILLFSQFTSMLTRIESALDEMGISTMMLTGETEKETRMDMVTRFNAGEAEVFLISLKAGGTGLNLTGADVVIHYDPWWNVSAQNQATDRAYRMGQTRGVQVIRMIASNSVEERILNLQEHKKTLGDSVLMGEENFFNMDMDTLKEILVD